MKFLKLPVGWRCAGLVTTGLVTVFTLSGCALNDAAAPVPPATGEPTAETVMDQVNAAIDAITVTGPLGSEPVVDFQMPLSVLAQETRLVSDGDGLALHDGQFVSIDAAMWRTDTGEKVLSTWEDDYPESFIFGGSQFGMLAQILQGSHVGARAIILNPTTLPTGETPTVLTLFEVIKAVDIPDRATGTPSDYDPDATGILVSLADNGAPSIEFAGGFEPTDELQVYTLIEGDGPVVTTDQMLAVHYTGWLLDGEEFDSSWTRDEPALFPLTGVIQGWTQGLAGQRVGSQVLLIIPPELAYGDRQAGSIPPGSTLVFVVDILYAD